MRKVLSILGQLSDDDVDWIIAHGVRADMDAGAILIEAGQHVGQLYIVLDGEVLVYLPNGTELARLGVGEILGEMSLVDRSPPSASVRATQPSVMLALDQQRLHAKMASDIHFAANMYRAIACFLSLRMRTTISNFGYGKVALSLADEVELDEAILDQIHLAGARFERMRHQLLR